MKKVSCQHGDVLIVKVDCIPSEAKSVKLEMNHCIEHGEGVHRHTIVCEKPLSEMCDMVELFEKDGTLYMKVKQAIKIDHEEHGIQEIEPGIYKKNIEREYDYESNEERRVID